jgi:hypothetical protein
MHEVMDEGDESQTALQNQAHKPAKPRTKLLGVKRSKVCTGCVICKWVQALKFHYLLNSGGFLTALLTELGLGFGMKNTMKRSRPVYDVQAPAEDVMATFLLEPYTWTSMFLETKKNDVATTAFTSRA